MEKRDIKVFDCDVFCTEDFSLYDDIVITGNFYAEGNVLVASLEAGGDIIINAPEFVSADTILSLGAVSIVHLLLIQYIFMLNLVAQSSLVLVSLMQFYVLDSLYLTL